MHFLFNRLRYKYVKMWYNNMSNLLVRLKKITINFR
jgi:hypothetical protein